MFYHVIIVVTCIPPVVAHFHPVGRLGVISQPSYHYLSGKIERRDFFASRESWRRNEIRSSARPDLRITLEHKIDAQRQRDERQQPLHSQARAGWRREFYGKAPTHGTLDGLRERNLSRERPTRASCILFWYVSVRN